MQVLSLTRTAMDLTGVLVRSLAQSPGKSVDSLLFGVLQRMGNYEAMLARMVKVSPPVVQLEIPLLVFSGNTR